MPTKLSRYFNVASAELRKRGVLNAHLGIDNPLFIDPLLLSKSKLPEFTEARPSLNEYFSKVIKLLAASKAVGDVAYREAEKRLLFREEHGAALGYAGAGGYGRAIGSDLAAILAKRGKEIVDLGVTDPEIFELIPLFQERFGPDLLSDMAVAILREQFLTYTARVSAELNLKPQSKYHIGGKDWVLPTHPDGTRPLILVPAAMLSELPVATDRSEIEKVAAFNEQVRNAWNAILWAAQKAQRRVTKEEIRNMLFANAKNLRDLIKVYRDTVATGYDFDTDPDGLLSWESLGRKAANSSPVKIDNKQPKTVDELRAVLNTIIAQFKKNVEENKLYEILYGENGKPRAEVFSQRLFFAVADSYCEANNVDLNREPNAGNGPVDFKLSTGYKGRALVEVKKSNNPQLLHGFETQLPAYEKSEATEISTYLVLRVAESESAIKDVLALREKKIAEGKRVPDVVVIDARWKPSASKL